MNFNLIQLWLMLQLTIRDSEAENIVIMDRDVYYAIKSKLDVVMRDVGISMEERKQYTLGDEPDLRIRPSERLANGACTTCSRRHKHRNDCEALKRREVPG